MYDAIFVSKHQSEDLKNAYRGWYVDIGPVVGEADKIWTVSLNAESPKTPLVLLHGLGSGVGLWILNLDSFAEHRPVYAIDILGFGRSSRPKFSTDAQKAEQQLVASIEEWRREMKLNEMILLGHSMGGFLAASYAISHPDRVKHLILADPWGFSEKPADIASKYNIPMWVRVLAFALQPLNPLWAVRAAGPFGQWVVSKARPDIIRKYTTVKRYFVDVLNKPRRYGFGAAQDVSSSGIVSIAAKDSGGLKGVDFRAFAKAAYVTAQGANSSSHMPLFDINTIPSQGNM
uniref:AB hydrolase-1 domain-containing protein n=1 Tax=Phlebotomus papatasi TaxID=29031 RepID=A0A1B0GMC7_PHLPP